MADDGASSERSYFIYDVFLSFRGEIRHEFTDHLYHALTDKGINTFRDDPKLRVGDEIRSALVGAIEGSRMSIVVLSQNYASSSWCLDELVKIMECKQDKGRPVFPIFYHVEPSDVRYQKNEYGTNMMKHANGRNSHKVRAWRSALSLVGNLSGKHCNDDRSETDIIDEICDEILKYLPRELLLIKHPIELDSRFEEVTSLLDIESHDALFMLCIYGDGETNKISFVGELCNKIINKFEVSYLLENVGRKSKESTKGLEELQKTFLSMIDHKEKTEIGSIPRGCLEIKRRLRHKRVLLILDDVDDMQQLEALAGGHDWFGLGSRIIITTSDEDLANKHELDGVDIKKYCIDKCEFEGIEALTLNNRKDEGDVVGFEDSLRIVTNQLKEENPLRNVVSITGMGGLGKTTLAQKIYNNNEVKELFPYRAWTCVSKDFNEKKFFLELLKCLIKSSTSKYENLSVEELRKKVRNCFRGKKYLVVLDDIWETRVWNEVKHVFPNDNRGSMILITSRDDQVANHARSRSPHHKLSPLNAEDGWELFRRMVFGKEDCPLHLEDIGKSIVNKCGGLPLAISTLAGLVAMKERSYIEWSQIEGSVAWDLAQDSTKVMDVLKVSYDHLPKMLKPCFLYFGIYPEDHKIHARELIQLWIVEGFIQPEKTPTSKIPNPEVVGDRYLKELVDRNLVQIQERRSDGGVKICSIHDLLRELCIIESKADNFLEVCTKSTDSSLSNACRLSVLCDQEYCKTLIRCSQTSTRSLFFFAKGGHPGCVMKGFPVVHVLRSAREVSFTDEDDPCVSTKMMHLKYLRMENHYSPALIPDWIWSLDNLEVLDLRRWFPTFVLSINIWKLERLKHFHVSMIFLQEEDKEAGANNKRMWNLQSLSTVIVVPKTMLLISNGCFPNLTKLDLQFKSKDSVLHKQLLSLHSLSKLRTLKIGFWGADISFDGVVFPPNITKITLRGFGDLDSDCMNALGRIPSLQILKLVKGRTKGKTLNCGAAAGDFPQLQVFHIDSISWVQRLTVENGAMPHLHRVVIRGCLDLTNVPKRLLSLKC